MTDMYVANPITKKPIRVGGPTYEKLMKNPSIKQQLQKADKFERQLPSAKYASTPISKQRIEKISKMGKMTPHTLEETLAHTNEPAKKHRLESLMKNVGQGRGMRTRGWGAEAPRRGTQRHFLKEQCGDQCFLMPETEGFPICPKCYGDKCTCAVDCRGLLAAKIRARQYKYDDVARAAEELESKLDCPKGRRAKKASVKSQIAVEKPKPAKVQIAVEKPKPAKVQIAEITPKEKIPYNRFVKEFVKKYKETHKGHTGDQYAEANKAWNEYNSQK